MSTAPSMAKLELSSSSKPPKQDGESRKSLIVFYLRTLLTLRCGFTLENAEAKVTPPG